MDLRKIGFEGRK